ncbi:reverse transcriptase domain-containing protein [Tanacetum coccineum]
MMFKLTAPIEEPLVVNHDKPNESNEVLNKDQPQTNNEPVIQTPSEEQTPSIPLPQRLRKEKEEAQQRKFLENLKQLDINLPFIDALAQMPKYAKFLNGLLTNKARLKEACMITVNERCSAVLLNKLPSKEKDPGSFNIPCDIGQLHINNALADLGASIRLMSYTMYEKLEDTINAEAQEILANDRSDLFLLKGLEKSIDQSDLESYKSLENKSNNESDLEIPIRRINSVNTPYLVKQRTTRSDGVKSEHLYLASANEIDEKRPELKSLPNHLKYAYLQGDKSVPMIISSKLSEKEKKLLLQVLEKHKGAIAWKMSDIKESILPDSDCTRRSRKDNVTCPYGTFAYKRMPFALCNASAAFQRCMTAIFHDMVEDFMEVFMDDFSVFGIEVDRAKIDVIAKFPYPTNVKGVRSFLGHAGFYRRFIKDFSMISKPMTKLLMKDAKFDFSDDCKKAFIILKERLTTTPIIISLDWNVPFKLMCDASDFAVGAVLGQRIDGKFQPIYYASKTLNNAQEHYTTTEKELLAVVFSFDKFRLYLVLSKTVVYIDHSALKYLFSKQDAKPRLIRLESPDLGIFTEDEIADEFPNKHLMILKAKLNDDEPWYVDYVNYIVGKIVPPKWTPEKRRRRCVAESEILKILAHCHFRPTRGHHSASITGRKVYESRFFWPSIFKDVKDYVMRCDACQRSGNISSRSEIPQNNIQSILGTKKCNMDLTAAAKNHFTELNELIELRDGSYVNTLIYKERTKKWHDSRLRGDKNFKVGDKVLLGNSRFKMHPGKLKSKWYGPNVVKAVYQYEMVEITEKNEISFKVNGQRLKKYYDGNIIADEREVVKFKENTT